MPIISDASARIVLDWLEHCAEKSPLGVGRTECGRDARVTAQRRLEAGRPKICPTGT
jgi:hypothetical protein